VTACTSSARCTEGRPNSRGGAGGSRAECSVGARSGGVRARGIVRPRHSSCVYVVQSALHPFVDRARDHRDDKLEGCGQRSLPACLLRPGLPICSSSCTDARIPAMSPRTARHDARDRLESPLFPQALGLVDVKSVAKQPELRRGNRRRPLKTTTLRR
jgi:hypothetical protein